MSLIIDQRTVTLEIANEFTCGKTPLNEVIENFYNTKVAKEIRNKRSETCLLYTSPSPRDQRGSRMPSSA